MAEIGDHVAVAAAKGAPAKRGTVVAKSGSVLTLQWQDGHISSFTPAPGSVWVEGKAATGHIETVGQADEELDESEEWEGGKTG